MTKIEALKQFFSTEDRPVTNQELLAFKKEDPQGFDELAEAVLVELSK